MALNCRELKPLRSPFGSTPPPLCLIEKPGRGLALVTTAPIKPGQVVLSDSPLVIYPTLDSLPFICSHCFRVLPSKPFPCTKCNVARFCSSRCLSFSHPSLLCHALPSLSTGNHTWPDELIFLLSAYSLPPFSLCLLLSLHSKARLSDKSTEILHSQLTSLISGQNPPLLFYHKNTSFLMTKEKINSFTLLIPKDQIKRFKAAGVPAVRASGLYLWASMLNHDCMPNVCRFHYIDDPKLENNTNIIFRALHEIKEGSEICTSYLDFGMDYRERQEHLQKHYGFKCKCDRCNIESQWKHNQEEQEEGNEDQEVTEEKNKQMDMEMGERDEIQEMLDLLIDNFFDKFICICGGFLAPLSPSQDGVVSDLRECNFCGIFHKDEPDCIA